MKLCYAHGTSARFPSALGELRAALRDDVGASGGTASVGGPSADVVLLQGNRSTVEFDREDFQT